MSTLKKATVKSSTFIFNAIAATAGAALMFFQDAAQTAVPAAIPAADATVTITPDTVILLAQLAGLSTPASAVGGVTVLLAVINQLLRYKTQRKFEKQLNG